MNKFIEKILDYITPIEYRKYLINIEDKSYFHPSPSGKSFPRYITSDYRDIAKGGYKKNGLLNRGIGYICSNIASAPLKVYDRKSNKELIDHPMRIVIKRPNLYLTEYCFWERIILYYYLSGNIFIEKLRNEQGLVVSLDVLRPDRVTVVPSIIDFIDRYEYTIEGIKSIINKNDIIHIYNYDPLNDYVGFSPIEAALNNVMTDNTATDFTKAIFENMGMNPGTMLFFPGDLTKEQKENIAAEWRQNYGLGNQGGVGMFSNDVKVDSKSFNFSELQFPELTKQQEARILMVLGVPPMLVDARLGNEASTYNNVTEARTRFWEDTINPLFNKLDDHITAFLLPEYPDSATTYCSFDTSQVPAFRSIRQTEFNNTITLLGQGLITKQQAQLKLGIEVTNE